MSLATLSRCQSADAAAWFQSRAQNRRHRVTSKWSAMPFLRQSTHAAMESAPENMYKKWKSSAGGGQLNYSLRLCAGATESAFYFLSAAENGKESTETRGWHGKKRRVAICSGAWNRNLCVRNVLCGCDTHTGEQDIKKPLSLLLCAAALCLWNLNKAPPQSLSRRLLHAWCCCGRIQIRREPIIVIRGASYASADQVSALFARLRIQDYKRQLL